MAGSSGFLLICVKMFKDRAGQGRAGPLYSEQPVLKCFSSPVPGMTFEFDCKELITDLVFDHLCVMELVEPTYW